MTTHHLYCFFICCFGLIVSGCEPIEEPKPESCDYDTPEIAYSDPEQCDPELTWLRKLTAPQEGRMPVLPEECSPVGELDRIVEIAAPPRSGRFTLHVYNGSEAYAYVQVFGAESCEGEFVPVTKCIADYRVAFKVPVEGQNNYDRYFVRISLAASGPDQDYRPYDALEENFLALAAYDGKEPGSAATVAYNREKNPSGNGEYIPPATLPVSCTGLTLHRLIFSSCGSEQDLVAWAKEMGLPVSEAHTGKGGSVVAVDVPSGMNLQTVGGATLEKRPRQDTTGTSVDPDYLINLFNPKNPDDFTGAVRKGEPINEIANCVAFAPRGESSEDPDQVMVTIIDSGVDYFTDNMEHWQRTIYRQSLSTAFMRADQLGYDFIDNDPEPDDLAPHGTFVAGAMIGGYAGRKPLTTVHFKIFGAQNVATYFGALVALREALAIGSDVVNMSWGFYAPETPAALRCIVQEAASQGTLLVTSAGNDTTDINASHQWPASFAADYPGTVVSVGSYDFENGQVDESAVRLTTFSNYGEPDAAVAAFMTTETPNYAAAGTNYPLGTSISAPIVTRAVANMIAAGGVGVKDLQSLYGKAPQLQTGQTTDGHYLPVCLERNMP